MRGFLHCLNYQVLQQQKAEKKNEEKAKEEISRQDFKQTYDDLSNNTHLQAQVELRIITRQQKK
ncbi:hypothetical protein OfM2_01700 [Lactovum odontotermitis]